MSERLIAVNLSGTAKLTLRLKNEARGFIIFITKGVVLMEADLSDLSNSLKENHKNFEEEFNNAQVICFRHHLKRR